jgi:hypothetical protein
MWPMTGSMAARRRNPEHEARLVAGTSRLGKAARDLRLEPLPVDPVGQLHQRVIHVDEARERGLEQECIADLGSAPSTAIFFVLAAPVLVSAPVTPTSNPTVTEPDRTLWADMTAEIPGCYPETQGASCLGLRGADLRDWNSTGLHLHAGEPTASHKNVETVNSVC